MGIVDSDAGTDALVHSYLGRLDAAAWSLPPDRRNELVGEVREHIAEALQAEPAEAGRSEVAIRNVLERLGPPEEIVRAESEGQPYVGAGAAGFAAAPPAPYRPESKWGGLEIAGVVLLAVGGFVIPIVGPIIGLVLVWASSRWTHREKAIGTLLALLPLIAYAGVFGRQIFPM